MPTIASVSPTGNTYVDDIQSGLKWGTTSLTFSFPASASLYGANYAAGETTNGFQAFTAVQQAAVVTILNEYASVANLTFTQVTESSTTTANLRYAESNSPSTAYTYSPSSSKPGGDMWFNTSSHWYDKPVEGNYGWLTLMHETGHALGLKHPQTASAYFPTTFGVMPLDHDSLEYTVMSYRSYIGASATTGLTNASDSFPQSLMMYDIAAIQADYGAKYTPNAGPTVYQWNPNTGQESINGVVQQPVAGDKVFMTVWDGSSQAVYDFSNYSTNMSVDLRPGQWTTVSTAQLANLGNGHFAAGNIANALLYQGNTASEIKEVILGSGNDTVIGNDVNNTFVVGSGKDSIDGQGGTNTVVYSGMSGNYSIVHNTDGSWTVSDLRTGSPNGTDNLTNIQLLQFTDKTVSLASLASAPIVTSPTIAGFSPDTGTVGDGATDAKVLTLTGSAPASDTIKVYDGSTLLGSATAAANGSWSFTTGSLSDGAHSFTSTASDASGNTSASSLALNVTVDTVAPNVPTIVSFSPDKTGTVGNGTANSGNITLQGKAEAGSTVTVYDQTGTGNKAIGTAVADANGNWSFSTVNANAESAVDDGGGTDNYLPSHGALPPSHGALPASLAGSSTGTPLADGVHNFTATATDVAGNVSALTTTPLTVTIDTTPPAAPTVAGFSPDTGMVGDGITDKNMLTIHGAAEAGSIVTVYDTSKSGSVLLGRTQASATGAWSYATAALQDGTHKFTATATDAAGNVSALTTTPLNVTVDTVAPVAPTVVGFSPDTGVVGDGITDAKIITLYGAAEAGGFVSVYDVTKLGTVLLGMTQATATGAWSYQTAALSDGTHKFVATETDVAGNTSAQSTPPLNITVDTVAPVAPTVVGFSPDTGVVGDGVTDAKVLTLTGSAEVNDTIKVYDGGTLLGTAQSNANGAWNFTTAALSDGSHKFSASATDVAGNTGGLSTALKVTVDASSLTAANDTYNVNFGHTLSTSSVLGVLANDKDIVPGISSVLQGGPAHGDLTLNSDGSFVYTADPGFIGKDSFTYDAVSVAGISSSATVTIQVNDGPDTFDFSQNSSNMSVNLVTGKATPISLAGFAGVTQTLTGVNNVIAGSGSVSIIGNNAGDTLKAGAGTDVVRGGLGNDTLIAGSGKDTLYGGGGNNVFVFGPGISHDTVQDFNLGNATNHDTLDLSGLGFQSVADVLAHTDSVLPSVLSISSSSVAVVHVGAADITLVGVTPASLAAHSFEIVV